VETSGFVGVVALTIAYLLWLTAPAFLPVTIGPDVVHHLQLIHVMQRTQRLVHDPALGPYLLEMVNYTPRSHILAAVVAQWLRVDALRVAQAVTAAFIALKMGLLYLVAVRAARASPSAPLAALAAPILAFVPIYTLGSSFHFFFYAQVVSEAFAIGMLLAAVGWVQTDRTPRLGAFALSGVGVFLAWPVWLGPAAVAMAFAILLVRMPWRRRFVLLAAAFAPIAAVAVVHTVLHGEGGRILGSAGAVTTPSVAAFGASFVVCACAGLLALRFRAGALVAVFLATALLQAAAIGALDLRAGARTCTCRSR
jgi:hypothetical protein